VDEQGDGAMSFRFAGRSQAIPIFFVLVGFTLGSMPVILSQSIRHSYMLMIDRQIRKVVPPKLVFAGDSLTRDGNWSAMLASNPLSTVNIAKGGALINDVVDQVIVARSVPPEFLLVMAGTNDILAYHTLHKIVCNYDLLLEKIPAKQRLIVTLIPYTSFPQYIDNIRAANSEIEKLAKQKGAKIIDLNAFISTNGILDKDLTVDGIHFSQRAYQIWSKEINKIIK
jgi:lysophospholipase L1-like esterase